MEVVDVESGAVDIIGTTVKYVLDCKESGEVLANQVPPSIFMVPNEFRDLSPSSFTPKVVSIGPLHRQDEHLQGFEVQKRIYLHKWLHGLGTMPEQMLRACVEKVVHSIERIRACYGGVTNYNDFELANMMVIDGCFILGFIQSVSSVSRGNRLTTLSIISDLLLIENQIPFFVLEIIFECTSGRMVSGASLTNLMEVFLVYFNNIFQGNLVPPNVIPASAHDHILGFVHKFCQPAEPMSSRSASLRKCHSAVELDRAGVNFKPNDDKNWVLAMKLELPLRFFSWFPIFMAIPQFSWYPWPTLKMPIVTIEDSTELILRNLIIYEQSSSDVKKYVTSYIYAMDMLIESPEDVALLVKSKVLINLLGSNENAANMINNIGKGFMIGDFFYRQQWNEMDAYYNRYWPNTIAGLKRTYFSNPWSIIALLAAIILFVLTVVQTIFTVKPK